jgi:alpha-mannosidase
LNQFHDILPGSSIKDVYHRSEKDFAEVLENGNSLLTQKLDALAANVKTDGGVLVYNPNGFACSDVIDYDGQKVYVRNIPALGYAVAKPEKSISRVSITERVLENDFYCLELDEKCQIISLYDKENCREVVKTGEIFNELQVFEDLPYYFDAWEINHYYKQKMWLIDDVAKTEIIREGARCGLRITRNYLNSVVEQTIFLYDDLKRIDIESTIDWHEEHQLVKAAFPVDIHANEAVYDIQFGNLKRPTHENTSWDKARFEVCAHKWADISDGSYGMSLINDCKYGHSAEGSTLKLTLLKCATDPNPEADKGVHTFRYCLVPHSGSFKQAHTARVAQLFNQPLLTKPVPQQTGALPESYSLVSCSNENVMIETVKKAEDSDAVIVRLYEYFDCRTEAELTFGANVREVYLCDMLENEQQALTVADNRVKLSLSNFEIVTLKIKMD